MTNEKAAFPSITVLCQDRPRVFCLNHYAFWQIEQHMVDKEKNPDYNVYTDFPWQDMLNARQLAIVLWAGFASDALNDKELWTLEKAAHVLEYVGISECGALIKESLARAVPLEPAGENATGGKGLGKKKTIPRKRPR